MGVDNEGMCKIFLECTWFLETKHSMLLHDYIQNEKFNIYSAFQENNDNLPTINQLHVDLN